MSRILGTFTVNLNMLQSAFKFTWIDTVLRTGNQVSLTKQTWELL